MAMSDLNTSILYAEAERILEHLQVLSMCMTQSTCPCPVHGMVLCFHHLLAMPCSFLVFLFGPSLAC